MVNEVDFFYHSTGEGEDSLQKMLTIIKEKHIYSLRKQNLSGGLFNGDDYISVAAWDDNIQINTTSFFLESSFGGFIFGLPCFILSSDIPAIKCRPYQGEHYDSSVERVSQYLDEWHVKDEIPIDKVVAIALPPIETLDDKDINIANMIMDCAEAYGWEVFTSDTNLVNNVRERFKQKNK